ncbi:hypothetical protein [Pseudoalteromonas agarivorans]|uniref:Uncharacterized protein n=1 Tax=Pseudoalteromonas agarivorans DSM 14585 TaxID=1312369 RepID=A0ACA8DXX7_9GAMM|nr:hypothetical protein [Pseudoalteromonas agarivorans]ATC82732.1 hypothetical protein PAGA_a2461 [Pseudoalteromonas agarivorans DSM 14585]
MAVIDKKNNTIFKGVLISLIVLAIVSMVVIFTLWFKGLGVGIGGTTETWSHFGSFFGGVLGPILSFFSFTAIICTVYLQSASNIAQASANEQAAKDRLLAEDLAVRYQKEQKIAFLKNIEHEKQQQLLSFFINTFDELESLGCEAVQDLIEKNEFGLATLSYRTSSYAWKAQSTSLVLKRCLDKFDSESAELIHIYATKCSGQINNFKENIETYRACLNNSAEELARMLSESQETHRRFEDSLQILKDKYISIWEEKSNN